MRHEGPVNRLNALSERRMITMSRFIPCTIAALLALAPAASGAQVTKSMTGTAETVTATVNAIDHANRTLTLQDEDGTYEVLHVPQSVTRFDALKVGDKVTAKYYENVVLRTKAPGEKDVDATTAGRTPGSGAAPGATFATQRTITATITAIDPKVPSITFTGPNGWKYSTHVEDKDALAKVRVGDKVDITWTAAALVSVDPVR